MQKNFVQRHALFFSVIVFCFVIVPFIRNAYAQEKADKKQQAETLVIRTQKQAEEKKVTKRRVVLDAGHGGYDDGSVAAGGAKGKKHYTAADEKNRKAAGEAGCGCCVYTSAGQGVLAVG